MKPPDTRPVPSARRSGGKGQRADIAIVGGGIIGCAIARELARDGRRVVLLERDSQPGSGATWAAAGILSPQAEAESASPLLDLGLRSRDLYPSWVAEIESESGMEVGYRRTGLLYTADSEAEARELDRRRAWQESKGLEVERVDPSDVAHLAPGGGSGACGALFFPREACLDPRRLAAALASAAIASGAEIRRAARVERLHRVAGKVAGVVARGEVIEVDLTILAAGCWSAWVDDSLARLIPSTAPVRGQMVRLAPSSPAPASILFHRHGYIVPRPEGDVLAGSTMEDAGFHAHPTASGIAVVLAMAARLWRPAAQARFIEAWAGLRPGSPDGLPSIGMTTEAGLMVATGHLRSGILLAPGTAQLVSDLVADRAPRIDPLPYCPSRSIAGGG